MAEKQRIRRRGLVGVWLLVLFTVSCDEVGDAITPGEARAIAQVIFGAGQDGGTVPYNDLATGVDVEVEEYDFTADCPEGGSVRLKGTIEYDRETGYPYQLRGTLTYDNCTAKTEDGETITIVAGSIDQAVLVDLGSDESPDYIVLDVDLSLRGSVVWETEDGRSGDCAVDLTTVDAKFLLDPVLELVVGAEGRVTGTICGIAIDEDFGL